MVEYYGLPDLFVTVTADEVSETRWSEVDDLCKLLQRIKLNLDWSDAPVESARLFHERLTRFMNDFVLGGPAILGRVLHFVTRYEVQSRGSVHAHIVLWINKEDVSRVTNEIVACVPALTNESGEFVRPTEPMHARLFDIVQRKQLHVCRAGACMQDGRCRSGYPFEPHFGDPVIDPVSNRWKYFRPGADHRNVVSYHPEALSILNNHMNIQRVTDTNWSGYMLKYALKAEPSGELNLDSDLADRLGIRDLSREQLKLLSAAILSRPVSPCEAALACLQIPIVQRSEAVAYIDSSPPALRSRRFTKWAKSPVLPSVDLYCGRPAALHNITFTAYFKNYVIRKGESAISDEVIGQDAFGGLVCRRSRLVRFTDFHPAHQSEAYFYNVLLRECPFDQETDLLSLENTSGSYFQECILRSLVLSEDDLEDRIETYTARNLYSEEKRQQLVNLMLQKYPTININELTPLDDMPLSERLDFSQGRHNCWTERDLFDLGLNDEFENFTDAQLTNAQAVVYNNLFGAHGPHLLSGAPGAGKTFLTQYMVKRWSLQGKKIILCATTGAAACRLSRSASTVHGTFAIPKRGKYLTPLVSSSELYIRLTQADVIIIDEMSMLTASILDFVFYRLRQVCGDLAAAFRTKLLLLVGDHAQLPAVCHHRLDDDDPICLQCHISRSIHWPAFSVHHIAGSKRHSDPRFLEFLNFIRIKSPPQSMIDEVLGQCFISEDDARLEMNERTLVLCTHRSDALRFNRLILQQSFEPSSIIPLPRTTNASGVTDLCDWLNEPKFFEIESVAIGARVLLTANLDTTKFAANGSLATVIGVSPVEGDVKTIFIKLDEGGAQIGVRRTRFQTRHCNGRRFYKSAFPLLLGYAITGHRSQGATIRTSVFVFVKDAFAPGLLYVMLSRVTDRSKLKILNRLKPSDFQPVPNLLGFECS